MTSKRNLAAIGALAGHLATLEHGDDIVVMCHHGIRSAAACAFLVREGFHHVRNMAGGIDRWSREVDASVPRY